MFLKKPVLSVLLRIIHSGKWLGLEKKPETAKEFFSLCVFSVCHETWWKKT